MELLIASMGGEAQVDGLRPEDFHLFGGQRLNEKITECWEKLQRCWQFFKAKRDALSETDYGTTLTRNEWLLPLFNVLDYGRLELNRPAPVINDKTYAISHRAAEPVAIHLVSFRQDLDMRDTDSRAGAKISPHSMVQEFLNESDEHLYGFVSNGLKFRILRDNASLVRAAYIEFDLETMMETNAYHDFYLFFLLTHQSRVESRRAVVETEPEPDEENEEEESAPAQDVETDCWLEVWHRIAKETGVRALDTLRVGVQTAINKLGGGFLSHPKNAELHRKLSSGEMNRQDYYRLLLRLVYRLIFLLIIEDRELLFPKSASPQQKEWYANYYSLSRIRSLSRRGRGGRHGDLWKQIQLIFDRLDKGEPRLGIPALGSLFFREEFIGELNECEIANIDLLAAVRSLSYTDRNGLLQPINYRNIGTEELGSIYESLLEMHPTISGRSFRLDIVTGNDRKTSGSYYTPPELVDSLLDTALDPVIADALKNKGTKEEQEEAILSLKVCDPSCGSGHFLIGAAHRMGKRLAQIRTGDDEPAPEHLLHAVRDVIARCIYGVDLNPMAVELCKISLWIESAEPGKGLLFLDHHIRCGNSLLGATPELIKEGIPDEAFSEIEGDDRTYCTKYKKINKEERRGQGLFDFDLAETADVSLDGLEKDAAALAELPGETAGDYLVKESALRELVDSTPFQREKLKADLWTAAFVWKKTDQFKYPITQALIDRAETEKPDFLEPWMKKELDRLIETYQFFHWHLEFADVFGQDGSGGFDVVLGNPPWERIKLQEKEWFAQREPDIAAAANKAERAKLIKDIKTANPFLYEQFLADSRVAEGTSQYIRLSGKYPLCGRGDVNTYTIFAELNRQIISPKGRVGCIVPSGIASDSTTQFFFQDLMKKNCLVSLYDFENRKGIFPGVHRSFKFSLLTVAGIEGEIEGGADLSFFNQSVHDLDDRERRFKLSSAEIRMLNPNTQNCAIFRSVKDAVLTKAVYRRVPILWQEKGPEITQVEKNPWQIKFSTMFHMSNDSYLFCTRDELESGGFSLEGNHFVKDGTERFLPLYEAKMMHHYNHRFGDYRDLPAGSKSTQLPNIPVKRLEKTDYLPLPRYWVAETEVRKKVPDDVKYLVGWRDITNVTNERTVISAVMPITAVGNNLPLLFAGAFESKLLFCLLADNTSFVHDYVARQKVSGTHINFFIATQITNLPPDFAEYLTPFYFKVTFGEFILPRVLELTYTATDLAPFAKDCGYTDERGKVLPPFKWNEERRFILRCELDAIFFGLYFGFRDWSQANEHPETPQQLAELKSYFPTPLDALDYVMGTFPILKRKDLANSEHDRIMRKYFPELANIDFDKTDSYPTHAVIRTIFQRMTDAINTEAGYQPLLDLAKVKMPEEDL
ncbi:MAG: N-6 DNA methylase [Thermoguttaceae bacterium]|nr:N-6 DNA methylase [Thermoguttaceae bacterium]